MLSTLEVTFTTAKSAGAVCLPPKLKAGVSAAARALAGGAGGARKVAGAGAALFEVSARALGALAAAGGPKLNSPPVALPPGNVTQMLMMPRHVP